jgi:hypothetical protein
LLDPILMSVWPEDAAACFHARVVGVLMSLAFIPMPRGLRVGGMLTASIGVQFAFAAASSPYIRVADSLAFTPILHRRISEGLCLSRQVSMDLMQKNAEPPFTDARERDRPLFSSETEGLV